MSDEHPVTPGITSISLSLGYGGANTSKYTEPLALSVYIILL